MNFGAVQSGVNILFFSLKKGAIRGEPFRNLVSTLSDGTGSKPSPHSRVEQGAEALTLFRP